MKSFHEVVSDKFHQLNEAAASDKKQLWEFYQYVGHDSRARRDGIFAKHENELVVCYNNAEPLAEIRVENGHFFVRQYGWVDWDRFEDRATAADRLATIFVKAIMASELNSVAAE